MAYRDTKSQFGKAEATKIESDSVGAKLDRDPMLWLGGSEVLHIENHQAIGGLHKHGQAAPW